MAEDRATSAPTAAIRITPAAGRRWLAPALCAALVLLAPGCKTARLDTVPSGASVWIDDQDTGLRTPAKVTLRDLDMRGEGVHRIQLRLDGFEPSPVYHVRGKVSGGKIVLCCLVPPCAIIFAFVGFRQVDPGDVVHLFRTDKPGSDAPAAPTGPGDAGRVP